MVDGIKDMLVNILFLLLPLFLTQVFWLDSPKQKTIPGNIYTGICGGISAILCMSAPHVLGEGFFFDLRQVAVILSFLYGGYQAGWITTAMMVGYRIYLGGDGMYGSITAVGLIIVLYTIIAPRFHKWSLPTRISAAVGLSLAALATTRTIGYILFGKAAIDNTSLQEFFLLYGTIQCVATWIIAYFIELMARNIVMRDILEQSKKMKLVSELAASVSHEVRNPLTVTRGFIQLLRQEGLSPSKRSGFIDMALGELDRAESIISDYLNFAKPQLGEPETLELRQEIQYVADVISPFATMNQVEIRLELIEECSIRGEKDKFRQCLLNLAKNSIEAMPDGGILQFSLQQRNGKAEILLQDNGIGMTEEQIAKLGTPYYSTKEKGTGLGTMVVYSIIQAMGGKIQVQSSLGSGTRFILQLPQVA